MKALSHTKVRVMTTRPLLQAKHLIDKLELLGCEVISMPILEIKDLPETPSISNLFTHIEQYYAVIIISANAAQYAINYMKKYPPIFPKKINWIAVGPVTRNALERAGISSSMPLKYYDSEGVLDMPSLHASCVNNQKILIIRGYGGRETLARTLTTRQAIVEYAELYQRIVPEYSNEQWRKASQHCDLLLISSGQGLNEVISQYSNIADQIKHIIVPSLRIEQTAKKVGFKNVYCAESAQDNDIVRCINKYMPLICQK
jgi:uroporphyrinogen-III synthase